MCRALGMSVWYAEVSNRTELAERLVIKPDRGGGSEVTL